MPHPYPGQEWKHGWIPLTPSAAREKNHGRAVKPGSAAAKARKAAAPTTKAPAKSGSAPRGSAGAGEGRRDSSKGSPAGKTASPAARTGKSAPTSQNPRQSKAAKPDPQPGKPASTPPPKDKEFLDSHYGEWKDGLSPAQEKAMRFYQSPGFALMNGQLRGLDRKDIKADVSFDDADLKRAEKASKDLKSAIRKAPPLTEPMTVYRGFSADQFGDLKPGMQIQDKAFVSTSITNDVGSVGRATRQATAEIVLPQGTKAAAGSSREMVLPPGSKFRVQSVTTRKGVPHVVMELVL